MLKRVEKLTDLEKAELTAAEVKVRQAVGELEVIRSKIAKAHDMEPEPNPLRETPPWEDQIVSKIDGDFILLYHESVKERFALWERRLV